METEQYKRVLSHLCILLRILFFRLTYPFRKHDNSCLAGTSYHSLFL